eukprot:593428-Lingulodinium_polyedra.AAC.1
MTYSPTITPKNRPNIMPAGDAGSARSEPCVHRVCFVRFHVDALVSNLRGILEGQGCTVALRKALVQVS